MSNGLLYLLIVIPVYGHHSGLVQCENDSGETTVTEGQKQIAGLLGRPVGGSLLTKPTPSFPSNSF